MGLVKTSQRGFSLINVMIATVLMVMLALFFASQMKYQNDQVLAQRYLASRDNLKMLVERYIASPDKVKLSYPKRDSTSALDGNLLLDICTNGISVLSPPTSDPNSTPPITTDPACPDNIAIPFNLVDPGTPAQYFAGANVHYDINGKICTTPSATCPLDLTTSFVAKCASTTPCNALLTPTYTNCCASTSNITIKYNLQQNSTIPNSTFLKTMTNSVAMLSSGGSAGGLPCIRTLPVTGTETMTVPSGVTQISYTVIGGGGGGSGISGGAGGGGGGGSSAIYNNTTSTLIVSANGGNGGVNATAPTNGELKRGTAAVNPGDTLVVYVGGGGGGGWSGGYGGGGGAGYYGGGGGHTNLAGGGGTGAAGGIGGTGFGGGGGGNGSFGKGGDGYAGHGGNGNIGGTAGQAGGGGGFGGGGGGASYVSGGCGGAAPNIGGNGGNSNEAGFDGSWDPGGVGPPAWSPMFGGRGGPANGSGKAGTNAPNCTNSSTGGSSGMVAITYTGSSCSM